MSSFFVLNEAASGYGLFQVDGFEEIASLLPVIQESVTEYKSFAKLVKLKAFFPFKTAESALKNINKITKNKAHSDLLSFLKDNLPKVKSMAKRKQFLGVTAPKLGKEIGEKTDVPCKSNDLVHEIIRGIRLHLGKFVTSLSSGVIRQAQLGLGHGYSRSKVKFDIKKQDNMLIQAISLLDHLDKDLNTNAMRVKEWYSWHFPELQKALTDNVLFARFVKEMGARPAIIELPEEECIEKIVSITNDEDIAKNIFSLARSSMGFEISAMDLEQVQVFSARVIDLYAFRAELSHYLSDTVEAVCPNLGVLLGDGLASRLVSHAGSLVTLAKSPASTIQILGAEKALFRALKTKGNTPKYGLLFNSSYIGKAKQNNKGKISRFLANKCAIAARIDCFAEGITNGIFGRSLKEQIEQRLNFLETGEKPTKNMDVMQDAIKEVKAINKAEKSKKKKRKADGDEKKKKKKRKSST